MDIRKKINNEILIFDGTINTFTKKYELEFNEIPEILNFTKDKKIIEIYKEDIKSGANFITTNTFKANEKNLKNLPYTVEEVIEKAVNLAKEARGNNDVSIALGIGTVKEETNFSRDLEFEEMVSIFKREIIAGEKAGADLILIESMSDLYEVKAAIIAAKEVSSLPIFVTMIFDENCRSATGCLPESMAITLEALGVDAIGISSSLEIEKIVPTIEKIIENTNLPIIIKSNNELSKFIKMGVSILGGSSKTTPDFIKGLSALRKFGKINRGVKKISAITSEKKVVYLDEVRIIGERINPTGKKEFKEALIKGDINYVVNQGIEQTEGGAEILDVNLGLNDIDEEATMIEVVKKLQLRLDLPLQIDSNKKSILESGIRYYNGKPIVNSVTGDDKSLNEILPIVKKYGASVVGLTLDSKGIPKTAEERFKIAEKILNKAIEYGIKKEDVYIDCLVLPVSLKEKNTRETLKALRMVKERLGVKTLLGISNISYGLSDRDSINETFLALALEAGIDLPIINPNKEGMINTIKSFKLLSE